MRVLLLALLLALPGSGLELRLCVSADGHVALSADNEHSCRGEGVAARPCHERLVAGHGDCVDWVFCLADAGPLRTSRELLLAASGAVVAPGAAAVALPAALPQTDDWRRLPEPRGAPALQHLRTVVLRV